MDYSKPIIVRIKAIIRRAESAPENPRPIDLYVEGRAGPPSGGRFFLISSHKTVEEARKHLEEVVERERRWFSTFGRPVVVKVNMTVESV
ncbi:MAG: hypothetical protein QXT16_08510 [Candidatus Caldarchaeum sp.]